VRHVAEVHVEQEQLDADVLESGSGDDGSTVRQLSGKWVPLRVENGAKTSPLFEIALVFVRLDHATSFIVNANHGIM
jgi:hypothetical protein